MALGFNAPTVETGNSYAGVTGVIKDKTKISVANPNHQTQNFKKVRTVFTFLFFLCERGV